MSKKIENFMLPEHFNKIYPYEASSSLNLTREVADKINEIIDLVNQFSSDDLQWKQTQEGIIRKAKLYMKDNLLNSLHDLVELLKRNGYFDKTIAEYTDVLEKRLDNLLGQLKSGTTSMDAEIIDARVNEIGYVFTSLGEHIREQMTSKVSIDGYKQVKVENLEIVDIINPNFFDMRTAKMTPIYGAFSENNFLRKTENTAKLTYNAAAQFSLEIDNTNKSDVYIRIDSNKPMDWVRLTDNATNTQGSTLGTATKHIETTKDIASHHYLVFYVSEPTEITVYINEGTSPTSSKVNSRYLPSAGINTWKDKKVIFLGDSITANTNAWIGGLKEHLELSETLNKGVGGSTITNNGTNTHFSTRVDASFQNYDCVLVMGGTNDEGQSVAIGTFKGAISELIQKIQTTAPEIKIIFSTPVSGRGKTAGVNETSLVTNSLGLTTKDYANAMLDVCREFSIPCVDLFGECGINPFNRSSYIEDTVHPNVKGQEKILNVMLNAFNRFKY